MAKLQIRKVGDEVLRKVCRPVEEITPRVLTLLDDMTETMRAANGCGLAAVQVGVLRRVVVIEVEEGEVIELINPRIVAKSGEQQETEGCLSLPDKWGITRRPAAVVVRAQNRKGEEVEIRGTELLARALCHEIDHLDGHLFTDRVVRSLSKKEMRELQ